MSIGMYTALAGFSLHKIASLKIQAHGISELSETISN